MISIDETRMRHFRCLDQAQQAAAIRRLHAAGHSEFGIAAATGLSAEQIRQIATRDATPKRSAPSRGVQPHV